MEENGLIRKLRLISKFMTLKTGTHRLQSDTIHMTQYLKKEKQSDNGTWLVYRI